MLRRSKQVLNAVMRDDRGTALPTLSFLALSFALSFDKSRTSSSSSFKEAATMTTNHFFYFTA